MLRSRRLLTSLDAWMLLSTSEFCLGLCYAIGDRMLIEYSAGYGLAGEFESLSEEQIRKQVRKLLPTCFAVTPLTQNSTDGSQLLRSHRRDPQSPRIYARSKASRRCDSTSHIHWWSTRCPSLLHVLRLQMGCRRLYRSPFQRAQARMEHLAHLHRTRWFPHRLGR